MSVSIYQRSMLMIMWKKSILILGLSAANGINILMRSCHFMKNTFLQKQTFANSFIIIIALLYGD